MTENQMGAVHIAILGAKKDTAIAQRVLYGGILVGSEMVMAFIAFAVFAI